MTAALGYSQCDIYKTLRQQAITVPALFQEIGSFDFESIGEESGQINEFVTRCFRKLEILSIIATGYAASHAQTDDSLVE